MSKPAPYVVEKRPAIPHDPPKSSIIAEIAGEAKREVRRLAEAGKLSGRSAKIPHYGETTEGRSFHPTDPGNEQDVKA